MCRGTGESTAAILRRAGNHSEIYGIDLSSGQLEKAAKHPQLKNAMLVEGDTSGTGFP